MLYGSQSLHTNSRDEPLALPTQASAKIAFAYATDSWTREWYYKDCRSDGWLTYVVTASKIYGIRLSVPSAADESAERRDSVFLELRDLRNLLMAFTCLFPPLRLRGAVFVALRLNR